MRSRCVALLAMLALASGLSACGSDDELSTDIPRTSPDLTLPTATTEIAPSETTTTPPTSTSTTSTPPTAQPSAPPAAAAEPPPAAAPPQAPPPPASTTGGAKAPSGQSTTGGAQAGDSEEFQTFCRDNPGAPPPC